MTPEVDDARPALVCPECDVPLRVVTEGEGDEERPAGRVCPRCGAEFKAVGGR